MNLSLLDRLNNIDGEIVDPIVIETSMSDRARVDYGRILDNVQGNILKDHGRDYATYVVLKGFTKTNSAQIRDAIQKLAMAVYPLKKESSADEEPSFHYLASAKEQHLISRSKNRDMYFVNFFLSKSGYEALGIQPPDELAHRTTNDNKTVAKTGLKDAIKQIVSENTSNIEETGIPLNFWENNLDKIDGLILIAHDKREWLWDLNGHNKVMRLRQPLKGFVEAFQPYIDPKAIQFGNVMYDLPNADLHTKDVIEHFGYRDGISNPLFYTKDIKRQESWDIPDVNNPYGHYSQAAPLNLALVPDPNRPEDDACGSYCVFGKLEQDVRGFHKAIERLADALVQVPQAERWNRAKALVMGRFPDGTPLALRATPGGIPGMPQASSINNFLYTPDIDVYGGRCPMQAHIRRINPRGSDIANGGLGGTFGTQARRIVRRGITYGDRPKHPRTEDTTEEELPETGVGMLFMAFQGSFSKQFEHIVSQWALYSHHRDAVVAEKQSGKELAYNNWPVNWPVDIFKDRVDSCFCDFRRHVKVLGGEYFFAPSIKFLQNIAKTQ